MPNIRPWRRVLQKAYSYGYVAIWDRWFRGRQFLVSECLPVIVVGLLGIELIGAFLDFFPLTIPESMRFGVALALCSTAGFLVWHHRVQESVLKRHESILVTLREVCVKSSSHGGPRGLYNILEALVVGLESDQRRDTMHASLLIQRRPGDSFRFLDQYPSYTFPGEITLDPNLSSAALCAAAELNTILYLPAVEYIHGVKMEFEAAHGASVTPTDIVENAFQRLGPDLNQAAVRSLLCIQVPNVAGGYSRILDQLGMPQESKVILCLGSRKSNDMGLLELNTSLLAANLLGMVLKGNS